MENCLEPGINEKQKQMDAFVEDALNRLNSLLSSNKISKLEKENERVQGERYLNVMTR